MKVLAMYLPQFHEIEENNKWWGKGYTEWDAVKKAKPLNSRHKQPKVPLDENYYDLSDDGITWAWQAKLAKEYGIYGFCIYHYWFGEKKLLEKPMEILRKHTEIDVKYCICWANESWTRAWYENYMDVLVEQTYGDETEWTRHFNYLLDFFKDERYIKICNKPLINIYHSYEIECLSEMKECWNSLAQKAGFDGVCFVSANTGSRIDKRRVLDAYYDFEPGFTLKHDMGKISYACYVIRGGLAIATNKLFRKKIIEKLVNCRYIYNRIEKRNKQENVMPGTFPMWDNTPRHGYKGFVYSHTSPSLFYKHLKKIKKRIANEPYDFLYINAWNEWGEGAYLEPDTDQTYAYLEAIKNVILG